jgi:hypothetical protein
MPAAELPAQAPSACHHMPLPQAQQSSHTAHACTLAHTNVAPHTHCHAITPLPPHTHTHLALHHLQLLGVQVAVAKAKAPRLHRLVRSGQHQPLHALAAQQALDASHQHASVALAAGGVPAEHPHIASLSEVCC